MVGEVKGTKFAYEKYNADVHSVYLSYPFNP